MKQQHINQLVESTYAHTTYEDVKPLPSSQSPAPAPVSLLDIVVMNDESVPQPDITLPATLPNWAMPLQDHHDSFQRTATYRCTDPSCTGEHDEYRQNPRQLPYAKICGCVRLSEDGTATAPCTAAALRRVTYPGEGVALNARRFEPLTVYEIANFEGKPDEFKRGHYKYQIPGRNNEPTEPGMIRHEITNIHEYNRLIKQMNTHETDRMRDHRSMHEYYWNARRKAMRENVDARIGSNPLLRALTRLIRKRSDQKSAQRYGKSLDAHCHAQLIEFNQGKIQDWCAEDTGWKSRRAK